MLRIRYCWFPRNECSRLRCLILVRILVWSMHKRNPACDWDWFVVDGDDDYEGW